MTDNLNECYYCGTTENVELHHCIHGNKELRSLSTSAHLIIPCCSTCHRGMNGIHGKYGKEKDLKLQTNCRSLYNGLVEGKCVCRGYAEILKAALKEHRELELSVYRMLKAELQKFQADKGVSYEITDDDVISLVGRLVKQRREAAEQFAAGGVQDRADSELAEVKVLEVYLPAQLSPEEVERIVRETVAEVGASSPKEMGKVMKAVMPKLKGQADGKLVKDTVSRVLQG